MRARSSARTVGRFGSVERCMCIVGRAGEAVLLPIALLPKLPGSWYLRWPTLSASFRGTWRSPAAGNQHMMSSHGPTAGLGGT